MGNRRLHTCTLALLAGLALAAPARGQAAFRAFWADAFHPGFKSTAEIDTMVARAKQGNYNAIVPEVLAYKDSGTGAHGAYWNSAIVPKATDISGGIDPLAYLCTKAHAEGIEVHAWLVTYRVSTAWPPASNTTLAAHSEWTGVAAADVGTGPKTMDGKYFLDPGSPEVQEYLIGIVRELVTNYPIDGINWDYIRHTQTDAGYPSSLGYTKSGMARFQRIYGYTGTPPTTDSNWRNFRRRTISELIRRTRAEMASITSNPRQPLRHTADLFCSGDAPTDFTTSDAYLLYQDWRTWMESGWLDAGVPMNYKDDRNATHAAWYRDWIDAAIGWRYGRHMYCGQGNYMNSKANSVAQMQYVYNAGADGSCNYAYYSTADDNDDGVEEADFTWYSYVSSPTTGIFTSAVPTPTMPWRNPATATEGLLWGRVLDYATGEPIDYATVQVSHTAFSDYTDGNGYYVFARLPASGSGATYTVAVSAAGFGSAQQSGVVVTPGGVTRVDFTLGEPPPCQSQSITSFDSYANGVEAMFRTPRYSGSTSAFLATTPNVATVTDEVTTFDGTKCVKLNWQFTSGGLDRWLRETTSNTANVPNPTIELDKPVRVRLRFESPAGASLLVCMGVRETGTTAAVGANGGTTGTIEFVGATSRYNGAAPQGKRVTAAPGVWQTLIFDPARDPIIAHTGDGILSAANNKGTIEHLAFSSTGTAGPFVVYVDQVEQLCSVPAGWLADADRDGDVDGADYGVFAGCFNGTGNPIAPGCSGADLNGDNAVDGADYGLFAGCFNGAGNPPACQ